MWNEWRKFTAELVTALLICGFCARVSLGEHPPAKGASTVWQQKNRTHHHFWHQTHFLPSLWTLIRGEWQHEQRVPNHSYACYRQAENGDNFWCIVQAAGNHHLGVLQHLSRLQRRTQQDYPSGLRQCMGSTYICCCLLQLLWSYTCAFYTVAFACRAAATEKCKQPSVPSQLRFHEGGPAYGRGSGESGSTLHTNFLVKKYGKRRRGARRVLGVQFESSASGKVTCCEDCHNVHSALIPIVGV